ncbi:MAG: oxidoreductase, partial [Candidatus Thermoplasmatota archaeon]
CKAECIAANIPCTGCVGPLPKVKEQGVSMISAIASIIGNKNEDEVINSIKDYVGTFYKYSAAKLLPEGRLKDEG